MASYVKAHSVPFAFGTGYGEDLTMGEALVDVPIITKPYHRISMLKALDRLIVPSATAPEVVAFRRRFSVVMSASGQTERFGRAARKSVLPTGTDMPSPSLRGPHCLQPWVLAIAVAGCLSVSFMSTRPSHYRSRVRSPAGELRFLKSLGLTRCPRSRRAAISDFPKLYLTTRPKSAIYRFRPVPVRGAFRDRHKRGMGCGGRGCAFDERCGCVRRSRVVLTPRCWRQVGGSNSAGDGDNEPGPTGESTI